MTSLSFIEFEALGAYLEVLRRHHVSLEMINGLRPLYEAASKRQKEIAEGAMASVDA